MVRSTILVTGALGYIGSHTLIEIIENLSEDAKVVALDNLSNSSVEVLDQIRLALDDDQKNDRIRFVQADITDAAFVTDLFRDHYCSGNPITSVIHFAALKAVGESIEEPLRYYRENVGGLLNILDAMKAWHCRNIIFSSSATVYGSFSDQSSLCTEEVIRHVIQDDGEAGGIQGCAGLTNPYGRTKWMCEAILHDFCVAHKDVHAIALRYFNPVGAHPSGYLSETPLGPPSNLMPSIIAAMQARRAVKIFGTDYKTSDGTAIRDYIHVVDLAKGHVAALKSIGNGLSSIALSLRRQLSTDSIGSDDSILTSSEDSSSTSIWSSTGVSTPSSPLTPDCGKSEFIKCTSETLSRKSYNILQVYNLGTGQGHTVKEVIEGMIRASGKVIEVIETGRRAGDVENSVADASKANKCLGWRAERSLEDACQDVWRSLLRRGTLIN